METENLKVMPIEAMNDEERVKKKLKFARNMLGLTAAAQVVNLGVTGMEMLKAIRELKALASDPSSVALANSLSVTDAFSMYHAIIIVGAIFLVRELKDPKPVLWVGALVLLFAALPSWGLPFAILGIMSLLDKEVRSKFIDELDISI